MTNKLKNSNKMTADKIRKLTDEIERLEKELKGSKDKYFSLMEHLPVGVYTTTMEGKIVEYNKSLLDIIGIKNPSDLSKYNAQDFYVNPSDRDKYLKTIDLSGIDYYEFQIRRLDGITLWGRNYPRAVIGAQGNVEYFTGILIDINNQKYAEDKLQKAHKDVEKSNRERKKMISKLESLSLFDDLTGLYNRRGFFTVSQKFFELADRKKNKMFLLFMDMDDLKKINDTLGHHKGDLALKKLADLLKVTFRKSDIIGRLGGDEFAIFPIGSSFSGVENVVARLQKELNASNLKEDVPFQLSLSMGISCYDPEYPCSLDELFVRADKLMYEDKHHKNKGRI